VSDSGRCGREVLLEICLRKQAHSGFGSGSGSDSDSC
jgi:hypothetical protein